MIVNLESAGTTLTAPDVLIVGSGAAGLSLAHSLKDSGLRVTVLEAGGLTAGAGQELYQGDTTFFSPTGEVLRSDPAYLGSSRLRYFGGTTNHWTNWCRPMDPIDFVSRPWIPHSGWPITFEELLPFYAQAYSMCGVPPVPERPTAPNYTIGTGNVFENQVYHIATSPTRFGSTCKHIFETHENFTLVLNAPVTGFNLNDTGSEVTSVIIRTPSGETQSLEAEHFVLCTGGIENSRLLLNAKEQFQRSNSTIDNSLGRYFIEDFHFELGAILLESFPKSLRDAYNAALNQPKVLVFRPTEAAQTKERLLNLQFDIDPPGQFNITPASIPPSLKRRPNGSEQYLAALRFIVAVTPQPQSQVILTEKKDSLGLRRAQLNCHFSGLEESSIRRTLALLMEELGSKDRGRVKSLLLDKSLFKPDLFNECFRLYGYHHMGGTRMADSPETGVVDKNCRMFGMKNLFIGGSSIFPCIGHTPPTLSIVALALRLGEFLRDRTGNKSRGN